MNPAPMIETVTISPAPASSAGARGEVARLDSIVHVLQVAREVDDRTRAPAEELFAFLHRRLARVAPDAAALLEQRPEGPGRGEKHGGDQCGRARPQLGERRHERAHPPHAAQLLVDRAHYRRLAHARVSADAA